VARYLVLLATTLGRWDEAAEHHRRALELDSRIGARAWVAHDHHEYAAMLVSRGRADDRPLALARLDEAIQSAQELGMTVLLEQATALKEATRSITPSGGHPRDLRRLAFELARACAERLGGVPFSDDDRALLEELASHIAVALDHARPAMEPSSG